MTQKTVESQAALDAAMDKALAISSSYEGTGYTLVAGNFDKMGISYGLLSWNIGMGTLQPLLKKMFAKNPIKFKTACFVYVEDYKKEMDLSGTLLQMCDLDKARGVLWAVSRQKKTGENSWALFPHWKEVFKNLGNVEEFREIQRQTAYERFTLAHEYCIKYNLKTERALALFYDCCVQQGSLKAETQKRIAPRIAKAKSYEEKLLIFCDEMKNQALAAYRNDVYSRRKAIAVGTGIVHGKPRDFKKEYNLTDNPI